MAFRAGPEAGGPNTVPGQPEPPLRPPSAEGPLGGGLPGGIDFPNMPPSGGPEFPPRPNNLPGDTTSGTPVFPGIGFYPPDYIPPPVPIGNTPGPGHRPPGHINTPTEEAIDILYYVVTGAFIPLAFLGITPRVPPSRPPSTFPRGLPGVPPGVEPPVLAPPRPPGGFVPPSKPPGTIGSAPTDPSWPPPDLSIPPGYTLPAEPPGNWPPLVTPRRGPYVPPTGWEPPTVGPPTFRPPPAPEVPPVELPPEFFNENLWPFNPETGGFDFTLFPPPRPPRRHPGGVTGGPQLTRTPLPPPPPGARQSSRPPSPGGTATASGTVS